MGESRYFGGCQGSSKEEIEETEKNKVNFIIFAVDGEKTPITYKIEIEKSIFDKAVSDLNNIPIGKGTPRILLNVICSDLGCVANGKYHENFLRQKTYLKFANYKTQDEELGKIYKNLLASCTVEHVDFNDEDFNCYVTKNMRNLSKVSGGLLDKLDERLAKREIIKELPTVESVKAFAAACRKQRAIMDAPAAMDAQAAQTPTGV